MLHNIDTKKKIGIWGFGVVGKSVAQFLISQGYSIHIMDRTTPDLSLFSDSECQKITAYTEKDRDFFLSENNLIIPSPGIDIRNIYRNNKNKFAFELDLFFQNFTKPIIAITGTVGKTTVTSILSQILTCAKKQIETAGNIGVGTLDLIARQNDLDYAVLEVSDIQLKYCKTFAPDLAIWTNFSPNHLDWHDSFNDYFMAKCNIITHQKKNQSALIPLELIHKIRNIEAIKNRPLHFFTQNIRNNEFTSVLKTHDTLFYINNKMLCVRKNNTEKMLLEIGRLPPITFEQNWLVICSALYLLNINLDENIFYVDTNIATLEHRLEKIGTINEVTFYNDSKSTTPVSTLSAVESFETQTIQLFLGGLSKGIDREPLIQKIQNKVKYIYCFGSESDMLQNLCKKYAIPSNAYCTLDDAFLACVKNTKPGDNVLFSPAGSSFDLFKNYRERGTYFKKLVQSIL